MNASQVLAPGASQEVPMLIAAKQLHRCSVEGADGTVGTVKDLLFDGWLWRVRYFDVDTGQLLPGRRVILSPGVIQPVDYAARKLATSFTTEQVKNSPPLENDLPVSRQKEAELAQYYAWGAYWASTESNREEAEGDPRLRSTRAVSGYRIKATDGEIGHVEDFVIDDVAWQIRYLVVDTRNWLPGRKVLVPPEWAQLIDWAAQRVEVGLTRETIEKSPEYDPNTPINRQYEEVFYDYYGRPTYWTKAEHTV
jgi:hypothetical protein